jgi:hypothetical protein
VIPHDLTTMDTPASRVIQADISHVERMVLSLRCNRDIIIDKKNVNRA